MVKMNGRQGAAGSVPTEERSLTHAPRTRIRKPDPWYGILAASAARTSTLQITSNKIERLWFKGREECAFFLKGNIK